VRRGVAQLVVRVLQESENVVGRDAGFVLGQRLERLLANVAIGIGEQRRQSGDGARIMEVAQRFCGRGAHLGLAIA